MRLTLKWVKETGWKCVDWIYLAQAKGTIKYGAMINKDEIGMASLIHG
jgi:hypothetical protein